MADIVDCSNIDQGENAWTGTVRTATSGETDKTYIEQIIPAKIALNMRYIEHQTLGEYLKIIFLTFYKIIR